MVERVVVRVVILPRHLVRPGRWRRYRHAALSRASRPRACRSAWPGDPVSEDEEVNEKTNKFRDLTGLDALPPRPGTGRCGRLDHTGGRPGFRGRLADFMRGGYWAGEGGGTGLPPGWWRLPIRDEDAGNMNSSFCGAGPREITCVKIAAVVIQTPPAVVPIGRTLR